MINKNHLLGRPLVFGDVEQIKALQAAGAIAEGIKPAANYEVDLRIEATFSFTCPKCQTYNTDTETFYDADEYDEDAFVTELEVECRKCHTQYEVKENALFVKRP